MRSFRRWWAAACAAAYFVTNVAAAHAVEKSLWEERRVALRRTTWGARGAPVARFAQVGSLPIFDGGSTPSQPPSNFFKAAVPFDVVSTALPFGAVSEMREGRPGAPVVFLVQDVHGNDGAQKNIGGLLTEWAARGVTLVGVEGAWVSIDLAAFHRHPSPRSVSLVADALRKAGWLSGAEWAGMTASVPLDLVGVESPDLYRTNVRAARDCVARRPTVETFLKNLSHALQNQKDRFYSPQLKAFDLHIKDYHEGREGLGAYARSLSDLPGSGVQAGPQVKKFLKAMDWESRLNFEKVEADRQALMDRLTRDLGRKELNGLFSQAVAYRTGKQTNGDFFSYLKTLCAKTRTPLASYQSFADYIAYVGLVQSINRADLLSELAMWEAGLAGRLANTQEERRLVAMEQDAFLLRRLLENEMSPDDWAQFNKRRNEIVALPARLREFGDFQEPQGGMEALFQSHEEFCRLAMARNGVLVSNLMSQIQSRKASRAVLVAGGFHTPGLQSELMKRGCSTVVVTPRIEKVEGKPLDVFARDPLPFDHLFAGKPISLSPELMTGNPERITVLNMAITMDALGSADRQEGLRTVRFNVAGKELLASMGTERSLDEMSKNYPRLGPVLIKDQTYFVVCAHPKTGWGFGDRARRMHDGLNMSLTVFGKLLTWFVFPWMASRMWIVPPSDGVDLFPQKNEPLASATTILAEPYLRYNAKVREIVHPYAGPYCVLYGGSGVDVSNALLISNFTRAFFVSPTHGLSVSDLMRIKEEGVREDPLYAQEKYVNGFSDASRISGKTNLLSSLSLELKGMSIPLSSLEGFEWKGRPAVRFYWSAPGESVPTLREIVFVDADITQPAQYSDVLLERFDLYLQRAGMLIPWSYRDRNSFIKVIERSMNPDGFFATDDFALNEPGEFIALMQSFPLELPLLSIPEEMNLLDQVIDLRSKKRGLRVWANQTRNGYGFLLSIRPMSIPSRGGGKIFPMEKAKKKPLHEEVDRLLTKVESLPSFDPRPVNNDLLAEPYARYAETVRRIVNPKGMPSTILYGGAGADVSHALLMAHFTRAFFVSSYKKLTLADLARVKQGEKNGVAQYRQEKREDGFADGSRLNSSADIVSALSIELQSMGVSLESIEFIQWKGRPGIRFLWQGAAEDLPITREIIFVDADITEPAQYKDVLSEKFDLYLQRAGMRIPYSYRKANGFIEEISRSMNPGAYFVTDDSALEEAGIFIDLGQYFPLKLRVVPIPFEQELLDQVISLRYIDRPGLKQLAMRESEGYGFLCRIRQMPDLSLSADMSGALSNKKHRTLSEAQGLPGGVSTNNLFFLPVGLPFDPLIGLTVAAVIIISMLFKEEILNWLKRQAPPRAHEIVDKENDQKRPSIKAVELEENAASDFSKEIARDLKLGPLQTQSIRVGEKTFGVEYDKGGQFQRVGSLFYLNADLWLTHRDYFENKLGAYLPNLIALPLETYNMPRESFLSFHAVLLIAKMMSIDLKEELVIDLGCGQGTLTLTALKLGAKRVVGIDQNSTMNESIFSAQGIRLGKTGDVPDTYDVLFAKGRIHKSAPPALLPHLEGARVLVANVGPTYGSYFEMVPAWSSFPGLATWLDGGHYTNTVRDASSDFISHTTGWEIGDVWSGGNNGDSPQETPAAFEGRRIPPVREDLAELRENPSDQQELLPLEGTLKDYWRRVMNSQGRDVDALAALRTAGFLPEEEGIPPVRPNLARLEIAIWDAADRTSSLKSLGIPVQAYVVGSRRIFFSEAWGDVDVLLSYQPDESLSGWIQPATVRDCFFEHLVKSLPSGASLTPTDEGAQVSWSDSKGEHLFELNVHPIPKNPVDAVIDSLPAWLTNSSRDPKALTLARLYYLGSLDEWGDYLASYPDLPKAIGDNEKKWGGSDFIGEPGVSYESVVGSNDGLRAQLNKRLSLPASVFPARTKKIEINNDPAAFVGGIGVSRRSVNDTLDKADRDAFSKALGAIVPTVFDMQGVEVLIDPRWVDMERNFVEELKNMMGVNDVNGLATRCVEAARTGDARASGAALAAWDDSKFLAGPNPEIVAALLAVLIGDKKDQAVVLTDQFAEAYNQARAGLLLPKLLAGTLMKPSTGSELPSGILLNISALFDPQAEETAKNNTWLALAAALSARERNPNVPLGLVVHGVNVNEQIVTDALSRSVPRWANFMTDGVSLFVQGNTVGKTMFVNDKFSLKALRTNPLWNRPLTVLGLSVEAIAESIDQDKSVDLIPLDVFVNKQLQQVLQGVRFVLRNA